MFRQICFVTFALLTYTYAHQLFAQPDCSQQITDNNYYHIDKERYVLSKAQALLLHDVANRLIGDWRGELETITCEGTVKHPIKTIDSSIVKLEIREHSKQRLKLNADLDFRQQDKKVLYARKIFERRYIDSFLSSGSDALILTEKSYQKLPFSYGTRLVETIYKIMFVGETLQLDIINYNNGFFNSEERWTLTRW